MWAGGGVDPVCARRGADQAQLRLDDFLDAWGGRYPAIATLWRSAWAKFIPSLDLDVEIRRIICSTNAIKSLNARYRRAVKAALPDSGCRGSRVLIRV